MRKLAPTLGGLVVIALATAVPASPTRAATATAAAPVAAPDAAPAPAVGIAFDEADATARNGSITDADMTRVCGANDRRFLGELLGGDPLNHKIPYRLGDIVAGNAKPTATQGKRMMISGTVDSDVFGTGDFPFDHPGGSDFNMDVVLDPAYASLSQSGGVVQDAPMHTELSEYMVPHLPSAPSGPPTGMTWEDNAAMARTDVQPGYDPAKGDRVIVMGRWVNDCGHLPFATELHPINFLGWSHTETDKTVAQVYYAPYREMQLYNADRSFANQVDKPGRVNNLYTYGFPGGLIASILRIQDMMPALGSIDHFESWGMIEAVREAPADYWVCAPTGTSGDTLNVNYDFRARPGVTITVTPDQASGCARVHTVFGPTLTTPQPELRTCVLPWDWLSKVAADEAGVPSLDLKAEIKGFVADQYDYRVDPDPIQDCYDPLKGEPVNPTPTGQNVTVDPTIAHPFYGKVQVSWSTTPVTTTSSSSSTSTSSTASSTTTTPQGQSLTVTPATVAQGAAIDVSSGGWMPDTPVTFTLDDGTVLGTIQTDRFGVATGSFTIPSGTSVGGHQLVATGTSVNGAAEVRTQITVTQAAAVITQTTTATPAPLPVTGASIAGTVALGSAFVLVGIGIVALVRRKPGDAGDAPEAPAPAAS